MRGSGCRNCPVINCTTMNYRGSTCSAERARFGLGDPMTNADRIRAMDDRELAEFLAAHDISQSVQRLYEKGYTPTAIQLKEIETTLYHTYYRWLQMPVEDE